MRRVARLLFAPVVVFVAACGGNEAQLAARNAPGQVDEATNPPPASTVVRPSCLEHGVSHFLMASPEGLNELTSQAVLFTVGTVTKVEMPRRFDRPEGRSAFLGDAHIETERVVFNSSASDLRPGQTVRVRLYATDLCGPDSYREHDGEWREGSRVLLLLAEEEHDGETWLQLSGGLWSNWRLETVDGVEHARNSAPGWSARADEVIEAVRAEKAAGRDGSRDVARENRPFG